MDKANKSQQRPQGCKDWLVALLVLLTWVGCGKKPETVQELFPDAVFVEESTLSFQSMTADGSSPILDDFEDGDLKGVQAGGRNWSWSQFDDMTDGIQYLTIIKESASNGNINHCLYIKGGDWKRKGAGIAARLTGKVNLRKRFVYDASAYSGIDFRVKATAIDHLLVSITTPETTHRNEGGLCMENCPAPFSTKVPVNDSWTRKAISFDEFQLANGKYSLPVDRSRILEIRFEVETLSNYDIWLDDFSFTQ